MKALVLHSIRQPLTLEERPDLHPSPGEVVVALRAAALNRRDYWITQGQYPGIKTPVVPGSDGVGVVTRAGEGVDSDWVGREVIINPGFEWGDNPAAQSPRFNILGLPRDGTFATEVTVPSGQLHPKPKHLDWQQAAALPLGGLTAYRAVFFQGGCHPGQTVLITGIGGGVATFALQFAVAAGAQVWVTSSSADKIRKAVERGARGGFDYTADDWPKAFRETADAPDLIVDSAAGPGHGALIDLAAPGGRIVHYGATAGPPEKLDLFKVFWKQIRLQGSTMGSPDDFAAMLAFVEKHRIEPMIDAVFPLAEANDALARMKDSPQFGKYVLSVS